MGIGADSSLDIHGSLTPTVSSLQPSHMVALNHVWWLVGHSRGTHGLCMETVSSMKLIIQRERQTCKQMTTTRQTCSVHQGGAYGEGCGAKEGVGISAGRGGAGKAGQRR